MPPVLKMIVPAVVGGILGAVFMVGLVASQTGSPDVNPASQPVLSYGDR